MKIMKRESLLGTMLMMSEVHNNRYSKKVKIEELNSGKSKEEMQLLSMKQKGLSEFKFGENVVIARNEKNAIRKAKNKGWL